MKGEQKMRSRYIIFVIIFNLLFSSCITQRKLEYIRDKDSKEKSFNTFVLEDYRLKTNDNLFIHISSIDQENNVFTNTARQITTTIDPYSASLQSYTIDKQGYIDLPIIGKILVKDKTVDEVESLIKTAISGILNQPTIYVKLVNRYVTVLGEVRNPGHYTVSQERLSILEALGLAGDVTEYGNRKSVVLLRNEEGKNVRVELDLTKSQLLESKYFYLSPNDVVLVKPSRAKFWGLRPFPFSIVLSAISTYLLIVNYYKI